MELGRIYLEKVTLNMSGFSKMWEENIHLLKVLCVYLLGKRIFYMVAWILENKKSAHSSILAWRIPWTEEPGGLLSMELHRVGHDWSDLAAAAAWIWALHAQVPQLCLTLCDPVDSTLPGSSVHEIPQARTLEWVVMFSSSRSSQPRDQTCIFCIANRLLTTQPLGKPESEPGTSKKYFQKSYNGKENSAKLLLFHVVSFYSH